MEKAAQTIFSSGHRSMHLRCVFFAITLSTLTATCEAFYFACARPRGDSAALEGAEAAMRCSGAPVCCICINCKLVDRCKLYHWVEDMHEQPHVTDSPDFDPPDPQVQVFIRNEDEAPPEMAVEAALGSDDTEAAVDPTDGLKTRFLTTEYDVFACDSFVAEQGKWLRLMPDADFLPT